MGDSGLRGGRGDPYPLVMVNYDRAALHVPSLMATMEQATLVCTIPAVHQAETD